MAGIINTGSLPKLLWPGINKIWGQAYADHQEEYTDLVDVSGSDKSYEEDVQVTGFGLAPVKAEGQPINYDSQVQGYLTRYVHIAYGNGYVVTKEEIEDNLYMEVAAKRTPSLARGFRQTKENVVANLYNRAFNASYTLGDGVSLLNTAHPQTSGGTFANKQTVDADLSEVALEDMIILMMQATDDRGLLINLLPRSLIVPPALWFNANRILKSTLQNNTANNAVNVLKMTNALPEGIKLNHYLTSSTNWFVRSNIPKDTGLRLITRVPISFEQDNDFDTYNMKYAARERYSAGASDPRALYGSNAP